MKNAAAKYLALLQSPNEDERHEARLALGGVEPEDNWEIAPLILAAASSNTDLVFWSVTALGRLHHRAESAVRTLGDLARSHPAFGVRQAALHALSEIDPGSSIARAAIFSAFEDESPFVRREALQSAISVPAHTAEELEQIGAMAADPDQTVSAWSEVALRNIRVRGKSDHAL